MPVWTGFRVHDHGCGLLFRAIKRHADHAWTGSLYLEMGLCSVELFPAQSETLAKGVWDG